MSSQLYILPYNRSDDDGDYYFDVDRNHTTLIYADSVKKGGEMCKDDEDEARYKKEYEEDYVPQPEVPLPTKSSERSKGIRSQKNMSQD